MDRKGNRDRMVRDVVYQGCSSDTESIKRSINDVTELA